MEPQSRLFMVNSAYLFKRHRVRLKKTLKQASEITGVHENGISRLESAAHLANVDTYIRMQRGYGIKYSKVFKEHTTEPSRQARKQIDALAQALGGETRKKNKGNKKRKRTKRLKDEPL